MFSFFKKKVFLKDYLKGFVDIHNHILPGIDDGASNVEDSISLIKRFSEIGVKSFIATPHIMNDYYPNTPETVNNALEVLKQGLNNSGLRNIQVKAAAEYMMDQSFLEHIDNGQLLTLKDDLVLVEMSYFQAPINLNEILFQLQTKKYKPVLAHPERYAFFHSKSLEKYKELKDRGCFFQLNILSITGHYGKNIQATAFQLLDAQLIDYIGTDTHQMRHLDKLWNFKIDVKRAEQLKLIINRTSSTFES
ncbi:tyrosine-protein phosphatase [Salinimicrobium sp. GXAS 041]|uniref:tyrosine-protein phosphatase n=1 Tax=Salinimicrobium sp. GXAS 041 TaxID=3400806 RepID=UPI003C72CBD9